MTPHAAVNAIERDPSLPNGPGDAFAGHGVIGLPFRSGHVLALRRFCASSLGPPYTSVWHRDPAGRCGHGADVDIRDGQCYPNGMVPPAVSGGPDSPSVLPILARRREPADLGCRSPVRRSDLLASHRA